MRISLGFRLQLQLVQVGIVTTFTCGISFFLHDTSKLQQCNCATFDVDVSFCGFGAIVGRRTISTSLTLQASDSAFGFKLVFVITCTCGISFFA